MEFKKATKADARVISILEKDNFIAPWSEEQFFYELGDNEFSNIVILIDNGKIIGYCDYWLLFDQGQINKICISKENQGKGLGSKLLEKVMEELFKKGAFSVTLEVRISNVKAINLYQKHGFEIKLRKKGYYSNGEDCYMMMKVIGGI